MFATGFVDVHNVNIRVTGKVYNGVTGYTTHRIEYTYLVVPQLR